MNEKITLPDLIAALSTASGRPRTTCEKFLKALVATVSETAAAGESVKIKGLGTFKVSSVDERKSVNVNTGEEMIIPSHRKISFSPDKALAEAINAPFAMFEPVELEDNVTDEMIDRVDLDTADESAANTTAADTSSVYPSVSEHKDVHEHIDSATDNLVEATAPADAALTDVTPQAPADDGDVPTQPLSNTDEMADEAAESPGDLPSEEAEPEPLPEPALTPADNEDHAEDENRPIDVDKQKENPEVSSPEIEANNGKASTLIIDEPCDSNKKVEIHVHNPECKAPRFNRGLYIGIAVTLAFCILTIAAWRLLLPDSFCAVTGTQLPLRGKEQPVQAAIVASPASQSPTLDTITPDSAIEPIAPVTEASTDEVAAPTKASDMNEQPKKAPEKVYDTITRKRFLTTMAKEHYGDYNLWPYIYDENKAILGHPDRIKPGTKVVIPPASKYGIDATNPACVAKAKKRGAEIYARYK